MLHLLGANRLRSNGLNKKYWLVVFHRGVLPCSGLCFRVLEWNWLGHSMFGFCIVGYTNSSRLFRFVMYCTERFVFLNYYVMFYIVLIDCFSQRVLPSSRPGFRVMEWNLHLWSGNFGRCFCHTSRFQNTSNIRVLKIYRHHRIDYILLEIELPFTFFLPSK